MTNEELDKICCDFAGLEPLWKILHDTGQITGPWGKEFAEEKMRYPRYPSRGGNPMRMIAVYPPVSTDWGAAGRLMDAIRSKGIDGKMAWGKDSVGVWLYDDETFDHVGDQASSFPMALCRAVAALAEATKEPA